MGSFQKQDEPVAFLAVLSKRAARRLIQRAIVLTERDRNVRRQVREARVTAVWVIADWDLAWTVEINHGHIEFDRKPSKKRDLLLTWTAEDFFRQAGSGELDEPSLTREGNAIAWRNASPVVRAFFRKLQSVLRDPVDENGVRLV